MNHPFVVRLGYKIAGLILIAIGGGLVAFQMRMPSAYFAHSTSDTVLVLFSNSKWMVASSLLPGASITTSKATIDLAGMLMALLGCCMSCSALTVWHQRSNTGFVRRQTTRRRGRKIVYVKTD